MYQMRLFTDKDQFQKPLILLSLQPQYWQLVLDGLKKYEYRRLFREDAVQAYIYVSSPRKEITGFIDFGFPLIRSPAEIADLAESQSPGSRQRMLDYLGDRAEAFAIPILSHEVFDPISLAELRERFGFTAPQSYVFLDKDTKLRKFIEARHRGRE
jgi:predicted transcriptional regulator